MSLTEAQTVLSKCRVIAVVGLSADTTKDSFLIASYLKRSGFSIIPVNPNASSVLGEKSYPSLLDIAAETAKT